MGEILDSQYLTTVNVQGYLDRTNEYLSTLGDVVDIWEIGNEINGEWLGTNSDVVAKMTGCVRHRQGSGQNHGADALLQPGLLVQEEQRDVHLGGGNIPQRMKQGLDYVLVSYYEEDCNNLKTDWNAVFTQLSAMFPIPRSASARSAPAGRPRRPPTCSATTPYAAGGNYVGGYFWWYFKRDMVPYTKDLWTTLNNAVAATN